jgi:hypothetical protein
MDPKLEQAAKKLLEEILAVEYGEERAKEIVRKDFSACLISALTLLQEKGKFSEGNILDGLKLRTMININRLIRDIAREGRLNEAREILDEKTPALTA